jgi:hypothetical protein
MNEYTREREKEREREKVYSNTEQESEIILIPHILILRTFF